MLLAKWAWSLGVLAAVCAILWRSRHDILTMLREIPAWMVLASFLLTGAAKFLLGENARIAAQKSGIDLSYLAATRLYNISQLGKYIPGSIWQFVGRATAYRQLGASYAAIRDSLMTESAWIIGGSASIGLLLGGTGLFRILESSLPPLLLWWFAMGFAVAALAGLVLLLWKRNELLRYIRSAIPTPRVIGVQVGVWVLLGLAFWVLVRACGMPAGVVFSTGLFAAAYAIGFMVPFAPAGLGVRDAILTIGLLPYASAGQAIAVTAVARLVYLAAELFLVAWQDSLFRVLGRREEK